MAKKQELQTTRSIDVKPTGKVLADRETTKAEGFFSAYANDVQMQTSLWDVRLTFSEIEDVLPGDILKVQQKGEVRMSPQLAQKVAFILMDQLRGYEERFGPIPGPPEPKE